MITISKTAVAATLGGAIFLCGCDKGTPRPGEGAAGTVSATEAELREAPKPTAVAGGPAGQTPEYAEPAGTGSMIPSEGRAEAQSGAAH